MTKIVCDSDATKFNGLAEDTLPVLIYGPQSRNPGASIGNQLPREVARLGILVPQAAYDFLTVALAVTAADTFVSREDNADDGWSRKFDLVVAIGNPKAWEPLREDLEAALHFLSGDMWNIKLVKDGPTPPAPQSSSKINTMKLDGYDCACLFSGGLDSSIGAIDLLANGRKPVLVSHSYRLDKAKQEGVSHKLPTQLLRFAASAHPVSTTTKDTTMRTRSLNFLAYGAVVASAISIKNGGGPTDLFVPENGVISLNAPLTLRRIGTLSTRTTHPHFLALIQKIFDGLGIPAKISNPYRFKTKGEMMKECADPKTLAAIAHQTVSCGKWKRPPQQQCGRCVPCLIRRASFHHAKIKDNTYYLSDDLAAVLANIKHRDDLLALKLAAAKLKDRPAKRWVMQSGALPEDRAERDKFYDVFVRGLREISNYI